MATIEDVARLAGVSIATVSRVLNGTGTVSPQTAEKVRKVVKESRYHANVLGSGLRLRCTKTVLLIISTIVNSFYAKVVKGVEDVAEANGYRVLIGTNYDTADREDSYLTLVRNRLADGVILMRPSLGGDILKEFCDTYPMVQCDCREETLQAPFVSIDNYAATKEMTTRLIQSGHRRIALLYVNDGYYVSRERVRGYCEALQEAQIPFSAARMLSGNYGYRNARETVRAYLETEIPDAIFALSDRMAVGAMTALKEKGLQIPADVSVAGFDDIDISRMMEPKLTTVSQNQYRMGALAMEKLLQKMHGHQDVESEYIEYEIKWRESVRNIR